MDKRSIYTKDGIHPCPTCHSGGHYNPVAAGLCTYAEEYKYSSAKFYATSEDEFAIITHWMG